MSATVREREAFIHQLGREGVPLDVARRLLRYGATLQRLAEAQCNGDWPADNGERKVEPCGQCEGLWVRSWMVFTGRSKRICRECRTQELVTIELAPYGLRPEFQGDPRGAVLSIVKASVKHEDFYSGRERGIAVPA